MMTQRRRARNFTPTRRALWQGLAALPFAVAAAPLVGARVARAQAYPSRPVKVVLPFGAGGVADVTSRLAAEKLSEKLGQRFVIENQPGPGGINAARSVITAPADGYTLGLVTNGTAISAAIFKALPFDPVKDFQCISSLGYFELVFATGAQSKYASLQDFIKAAKEQPGKLNVGTIAVGSTQHLGAVLFKSVANVDFQMVTYRNTPDAIVALLRDDIQLLVEFPPAVRGALQDKKIRLIASSAPKRSTIFPDLPTVAESGVPGYEVTSWNGLFAPNGTPKEVVDTINKTMHEILSDPTIKQRYLELAVEAKASTPDELKARLVADIKKWSDVIERANIPKM
jgi:tripartite-type tricarboxylate transporter receptor subunit TctC